MSTKILLKKARELIDQKNFIQAKEICLEALSLDSSNYNTYVFYALCEDNLANSERASDLYHKAIAIDSNSLTAYQVIYIPIIITKGLVNLYEKNNDPRQVEAILQLRPKLSNNPQKLRTLTKRLVSLYKEIQPQLAINELFKLTTCIDTDVEELCSIWKELVEIQTKADEDYYTNEFNQRRTRLGADPVEHIKINLLKEIASKSQLIYFYKQIITLDPSPNLLLSYFELMFNRIKYSGDKKVLFDEMIIIQKKLLESKTISESLIHFLFDSQNNLEFDFKLLNHLIEISNHSISPLLKNILSLCSNIPTQKLQEYSNLISEIESLSTELPVIPLWLNRLIVSCYSRINEFLTVVELCDKISIQLSQFETDYGTKLELTRESIIILKCQASIYLDKFALLESIKTLTQLVNKYPNNTNFTYVLGEAYLKDNDYDLSIIQFQKIITSDQTHYLSLIQLANIFLLKKEFEKAITTAQESLKIKETPDALFLIGKVYWNWDEKYRIDRSFSYSWLMKCLKLDPSHSNAFTFLGHFYSSIDNDLQRAKKCYQRAFSIDNRNDESAKSLVDLYLMQDSVGDAEKVLDIYLSVNQKSTWALEKDGLINLEKCNYERSISSFQAALRFDSSRQSFWEGLGYVYSLEGKFIAAIKAYERSNTIKESIFALYETACIKYKMGLYEESIQLYQRILNLRKSHVPSLTSLASSYLAFAKQCYSSGSFGRSMETLYTALDILYESLNLIKGKQYQTIYKLLGDIFLAINSIPKSENESTQETRIHDIISLLICQNMNQVVESVIKNKQYEWRKMDLKSLILFGASYSYGLALSLAMEESYPNWLLSSFWNDLSFVEFHRSRHETAIQSIMMALNYDRSNPQYWNALGFYTVSKDEKLSQHCFIKSLELDTKQSFTWSNLGFLYYLQQDFELSEKAFDMSKTVDPENSNCWFGLGLLKKIKGEESFIELFEQAYQLDPEDVNEINYFYSWKLYEEFIATSNDVSLLTTPITLLLKYTTIHTKDLSAFNLLATMYELQKQYDLAIECLDYCISIEKEESKITILQSNISRILCSNKQYKKSIESYDKIKDKSVWELLGTGLSYYFISDFQSAFTFFEKALLKSQDNHDIKSENEISLVLGQALYALGHDEHIELAKQHLFSTITRDPGYVKGILTLCAIGLARSDLVLAESAYLEIIKLDSEKLESEDTKGYILISIFCLIKQDFKKARSALQKCIRMKPWDAERWTILASHCLKYNPTNPTIHLSICSSAESVSETSLKESKSTIYINQCLAMLECGSKENVNSAIKYAQKAIQSDPKSVQARFALCLSLGSNLIWDPTNLSHNLDLYGISIHSILRLSNENDEYFKWAKLLDLDYRITKNNNLDSREIQTKIQALFSTDPTFNTSCFILLSNLYETQRDYTNSINILNQAIQIHPTHHLYQRLSRIHEIQGNIPTSLSIHETCYKQYETAISLFNIVKLYIKQNEFQKANETLSKVYHIGEFMPVKILQCFLAIRMGGPRTRKLFDELSESKWKQEFSKWFLKG